MRSILNWIIIIGFWIFSGCGSSDNIRKTVKFDSFDLFHLKGESNIEVTDTKKEYVEIMYQNSFPVSIKFVMPKREVTLLFQDSLRISQKQRVYVFKTSNFHGGNPGRQRIYTSHHMEYENIIYVSLSDTIICKTFDKPTLDDYTYTLHLYSRNGPGKIKETQGDRKSSLDRNLTMEQIYFTWIDLGKKGFPDDNYPDQLLGQLPKP